MALRGHRGKNASDHAVHRWANQIGTKKANSNIFFEGNTIYSYGYHFPMARHLDDRTVAMTTDSYSNTAAGHMSAVRSAASHKKIIYCSRLPKYSTDEWTRDIHNYNISEWIAAVKDKMDDMGKARQQRSKARIAGEIEEVRKQAREYIAYFDIKLNKIEEQKLFEATAEDWSKLLKQEAAARLRKQREIQKKGMALHGEWLAAWRAGKETEWRKEHKAFGDIWNAIQAVEFMDTDDNKTRLMVTSLRAAGKDGGELVRYVKTSKDMMIPVSVARRYYNKYLAVVKAGGCDNTCDYKMLDYPVSKMSADVLVVGCHSIARSEIDYVAGLLGWK